MNKAYKYRLYPTKSQAELINKTFGCCRFVYNQALGWRIAAYNADGTSLNYNDTAFGLTQLKKSLPWLREVDSAALQQALRNLQAAYESFFRSGGFPKFKSKHHSRKSYTTVLTNGNIAVGNGFVRLPKIGNVRAVIHREAGPSWKLKSATVSQDSAVDYYVSVLYEYESSVTSVPVDGSLKVIGLDYKSDGLYMDSDGHCADVPKRFRDSQDKLTRSQHVLSRRKGSRKGEPKSSNWQKQHQRVNKIYRKASNQRLDQLHKLSTEIANQYDVVCIETLNMKSMSNKGFGNGKATMDNGWGMFVRMLEYKLRDRGKYLIRVDKWYPSSQLCHICGHRQKMPASVEAYVCPECGMVFDRDWNAAANIRREGIRILKMQPA